MTDNERKRQTEQRKRFRVKREAKQPPAVFKWMPRFYKSGTVVHWLLIPFLVLLRAGMVALVLFMLRMRGVV